MTDTNNTHAVFQKIGMLSRLFVVDYKDDSGQSYHNDVVILLDDRYKDSYIVELLKEDFSNRHYYIDLIHEVVGGSETRHQKYIKLLYCKEKLK